MLQKRALVVKASFAMVGHYALKYQKNIWYRHPTIGHMLEFLQRVT
jgi:hypothetical protein